MGEPAINEHCTSMNIKYSLTARRLMYRTRMPRVSSYYDFYCHF